MAQRLGDISRLFCRARETRTNRGCCNYVTTHWHMLQWSAIPGLAARRFKKQIFLSIDVPPSLGSMGQEGRLLLAIERAAVEVLKAESDESS